jgi:rare lipoprotein A
MNLTSARSSNRLILLVIIGLAFSLSASGCKRKSSPVVPKTEAVAARTTQEAPSPASSPRGHASGRIVNAAWYEVPLLSLAYRRAGPGEFTAAHNHLPIGSRVRVTHLENGKSVVVRITDRGISDRRIKIDLCKGAAQELGMISQGIARVRMEILPEEAGATASAIAIQN